MTDAGTKSGGRPCVPHDARMHDAGFRTGRTQGRFEGFLLGVLACGAIVLALGALGV